MSLVIGHWWSFRQVGLKHPTLAENTDGRPQSRSPATAQREARGHSALLPPATYTTYWDTIRTLFPSKGIHARRKASVAVFAKAFCVPACHVYIRRSGQMAGAKAKGTHVTDIPLRACLHQEIARTGRWRS
ncbi:UNVERIFIED_ORG: hypothetical protein GGE64_006263 [Rhizobium etli]|jgi:hypothetical protein